MKKFEFRLQKVLDVKQMVLKKTQRDLALAKKQHQEAMEELRRIEKNLQDYSQKMGEGPCESVSELKLKYDYFYRLMDEIEQQERKIIQLEKKEQEVRELLLTYQRERKVLSALKEKQYEEYSMQFQREEQNNLDEIAVLGNND